MIQINKETILMENNSNRFEVMEILGINEDTFREYLQACGLEDKDDYHEEDLRLLEDYQDHIVKGGLQSEYQQYLSQGITPHEAMVEAISENESTQGKDSKTVTTLMDLKNRCQELTKKTMSLSGMAELLSLAGLEEKESYSEQEALDFLSVVVNHRQGAEKLDNPELATEILSKLEKLAERQKTRIIQQLATQVSERDKTILEAEERIFMRKFEEMLSSGEMEAAIEEARDRIVRPYLDRYSTVNVVSTYAQKEIGNSQPKSLVSADEET